MFQFIALLAPGFVESFFLISLGTPPFKPLSNNCRDLRISNSLIIALIIVNDNIFGFFSLKSLILSNQTSNDEPTFGGYLPIGKNMLEYAKSDNLFLDYIIIIIIIIIMIELT